MFFVLSNGVKEEEEKEEEEEDAEEETFACACQSKRLRGTLGALDREWSENEGQA